jgi:hypothetical protein
VSPAAQRLLTALADGYRVETEDPGGWDATEYHLRKSMRFDGDLRRIGQELRNDQRRESAGAVLHARGAIERPLARREHHAAVPAADGDGRRDARRRRRVRGHAQGVSCTGGDAEDGCEPEEVGQRFGIARAMAAEIMYLNDEWYIVDEWEWEERVLCGPVRPYYPEYGRHTYSVRVHNDHHAEKRWGLMRQWVADSLKSFPSGRDQ